MNLKESDLRNIIKQEINSLLNEDYSDLATGDISELAVKNMLERLDIPAKEVDRIEAGSTIGISAPKGYYIYLKKSTYGNLKKLADSPAESVGVKDGQLYIKIR